MKENGNFVALKISKHYQRDVQFAEQEGKILQRVMENNGYRYNIVQMIDQFEFRSHRVICFELLEINLYRQMKLEKFGGMKKTKVKKIA